MTGLPLEWFARHPSQADLISRDSARGDRFARVGYFGKPANLATEPQEPEWVAALAAWGLEWVCMGPGAWHDNSDVDAVDAVRSMGSSRLHGHKPAAMVVRGATRASAELEPAKLRAVWIEILTQVVPEAHRRWHRVGVLQRRLFFAERHLQRT